MNGTEFSLHFNAGEFNRLIPTVLEYVAQKIHRAECSILGLSIAIGEHIGTPKNRGIPENNKRIRDAIYNAMHP